jgi:hypothetical protein
LEGELKIGDLIRLKRSLSARLSHPIETPESMGLGIIIDEVNELFIFPQEHRELFEYDSDINPLIYKDKSSSSQKKDTIKTNICKVYWFKKKKTKWEYKNDLQVATVEATYS